MGRALIGSRIERVRSVGNASPCFLHHVYMYNEVSEEAPLRQEDGLQSSELHDSTDHLEPLVDNADFLEPLDNFENYTSTIDASDNLIEDLQEVTNM
ncbi:unnamed protein product [Lasius platythorax]|uniref:Uncharacterized protein n=1 Tax=Lasius platythorax TaxID=488582 RepID=A0AAV2N8U8_9HYME